MGLMDVDFGSAARADAAQALDLVTVYEQHVARIYGFVFSQVGNREEEKDLTSQIFLRVHRGLSSFEGRGSLEAWLFQVARRTVKDYWRERYQLPTARLPEGWDHPAPDGAGVATGSDQPSSHEQQVQELLERLPAQYRQVLEYRFLQRCSVKETAAAMNISEANVKVLQFRALRRAAQLGAEAV